MTSHRVASARLDAAFLHAREPVFLLGADARFLFVNRAWEELTGFSAESVLGVQCQPCGPTRAGDIAGLGGSFCPPAESLAGKPVGGMTLILQARGARLWRRVDYLPFHDSEGHLSHIVGLVRASEEASNLPRSEADLHRYELLEIRHRLETRFGFETLIGRGPAHERLLGQVKAAASTTVPVSIVGESGTGKRLIARAIHHNGPRRHHPLVPFDCGVLPGEVIEREIFGPKGDDGEADRPILAEGATLSLGNVTELSRDLQARIVRSVDSRWRLIVASSIDLAAALQSGQLREDFYYLATAFELRLRPLRERLDEIPILAQHVLERANLRGGRQRHGFTPEAIEALAAYDWPGNLHEFARVIDVGQATGDAPRIELEDLPPVIRGERGGAFLPPASRLESLDELMTQVERRLIEGALARSRQNKSKAAELLGISRPRLYRRIKELNIPDVPEAGVAEPALQPD